MTPPPAGLEPERFLLEHWQKRPLLLRNAFAGFQDPLEPEELAGLACEEEVEGRLVLEKGGRKPWELRRGPFRDRDFTTLPSSHWTLLVQDMEKHLPELTALIEPFRFLPDWRIDDLMISYAAPQGSVGPHVDAYDVFLIQGKGRRRWQIAEHYDPAWLADTDLRILKDFTPEQEWELGPGDMLYLPPGVAHFGVALEPCLTYSVGFRAPSVKALVGGFLESLLEEIDEEVRYQDPGLTLQADPGLIHPKALARVKALIQQSLAGSDDLLESWFGRFVTEPKGAFVALPPEQPVGRAALLTHLAGGGVVERNAGSRFAHSQRPGGESALFVDGQEFALGPEQAPLAALLCRGQRFSPGQLQPLLEQAPELLLDLINEGYLVLMDDD